MLPVLWCRIVILSEAKDPQLRPLSSEADSGWFLVSMTGDSRQEA
jgi:hypothetical protein